MPPPFLVEYEATEEATHLFFKELNGEELASYNLQFKTYIKSGRPLGKSHILIKRLPHNIWIDVYVSAKLRTIFPLMYHFNRLGEPRASYTRQLEEYIEQIKFQEQKS